MSEHSAGQGTQRTDGGGAATGLAHPRAVDILTTEHWSLLSARNLGYQEMLGRATIFIGILSAIVVALALLAQATGFGRETLLVAALLMSVALFIGLTTFVRAVAINEEDARWVRGMTLLRHAYLAIVPELERYFVTPHDPAVERQALAHGARQRPRHLASSLTTTSSVVAALNSLLAGSLASDLTTLSGAQLGIAAAVGAGVSLVSAVAHVRYAANVRRRNDTAKEPTDLVRAGAAQPQSRGSDDADR
jgi:hypothetical protein